MGRISGNSMISSGILTEFTIFTSEVLRASRYSFISATLPLVRVNEPTRAIVLPLASSWFSSLCLRLSDLIPAWAKVISSPLSEIPSPFLSTQMRSCENSLSFASITPSWFESRVANASKPLEAVLPSARIVRSPKSSLPVSILPSPFLSSTKMPDLASTQPVFSKKPLLSMS